MRASRRFSRADRAAAVVWIGSTHYAAGVLSVYGRDEALSRAYASARRAFAGEGQLILFAGEPGIGKSTLAERVAREAELMGAAVAWGRCWEVGGAPAYWPWIQVFRELGMPEDPFAGAVAAVASGASDARFSAFDQAVQRLKSKASERPLALVLDDLHAADTPSLLLLLLLARQLRGSRILAVGAYREAEARLHPDAAQLLAKLLREADVVRLGRLEAADVAAWLRDVAGDAGPGEAAELYHWTEGNPLFVAEALRLGRRSEPRAEPGALRARLGGVLGEHLGRLSASTRSVLEAAAVLGRDFSIADVAGVLGVADSAIEAAFEEATATSVVLPTAQPSRLRFSHVLMRDQLYSDLLPSARAALHLRAGAALLAHGEGALAAAAHHFFESRGAASDEQVAQVALAAAESSLSRLAFEEAARLARGALDMPHGDALPELLRVRLELVLAETMIRLGDAAAGRMLCVRAAGVAERSGAPELLARAALVYGTELLSGAIDEQMVELLRRALGALEARDSALRARLLARLAAALTPPVGPETMSEILGSMRAATAMARRVGDPHALLFVLQFAATVALLVSEEERFAAMSESLALARALEQPLVSMQTLPGYISALLAGGRRAEAEASLRAYEELVASSRHPIHRVHRALLRALFCELRGDTERAEQASAEARAAAEEGGTEPGFRLWLTQRLSFAVLRARPEELAAQIPELTRHLGWMASGVPFVAWALLGVDRLEEAAERLRNIHVAPSSVPSANLMELVGAAETCVRLGDVELGRRIYPTLLRAADRMFWVLAPGAILGPTARTLGDLARLIGRADEAVGHCDAAIAFCERLGAPPLVELCRRARESALRDVEAARGAPAAPLAKPAPPGRASGVTIELRREQDVWVIESALGSAFRLKHSKGLGYIRYLMDRQGCPVHVLELAGIDARPGDAGAILDPRAKSEYRERLGALREQLAEAESFGDSGRAGRLQAEIQALAEQLAGAVGLGGRDRLAASAVERTRINVQRCLKDALCRIGAVEPALGRYLSAAVKSGTYCMYQPL